MNANPTQGELLHGEFREKKEELKELNKSSILAKYGGAEYLETAPKELRQGQTEEYVEYSRTGQVIRGLERAKARSKYPEDGKEFDMERCISYRHLTVFINNHTAVWGSWYDAGTGTWGYACCHSSIHISYCSGFAGIEAAEASSARTLLASTPANPSSADPVDGGERNVQKVEQNYSKKRVGEGDVKLDKGALEHALNEEKKRKLGGDDDDRSGKKRKNVLQTSSHDVTEEELGTFGVSGRSNCLLRVHRGIPNEPTDDGGSDGKLCGFVVVLFVYRTCKQSSINV